jgi:TolB-like protein
MSAVSSRAVFLSYASQDATAAQRIADAMRAAGIEVWFDRDELVGGDAWDTKIRRQIKECALFVAVISAHTQARREGYFRLEWKLAALRTHTMADGTAFLLPVVSDDTREGDALVPEEFRAVQWTRLPAAAAPAAFCARVRMLLDAAAPQDPPSPAAPPAAPAPSPAKGRRRVPTGAWALAGLILIGAVSALAWLRRSPLTPPPPSGAALAPAAAHEKSLVVLPFENRSPDPANAFFADGVHEDVLANLSKVRELTVVPRLVAMRHRGSTQRPRDLGAELRVASLVTGTVQRVDRKVRVTLQLIDVRTEAAPWTWQRDFELKDADVMAIQTEMATAIASELRVVLSPQEKQVIARQPTQSVEAYDIYLRVRARRNSGGDLSLELFNDCERVLQRAVTLDRGFAEGWAELARCHSDFFHFGFDQTPARVAAANAAIETAQRLAPDAPEVILAQGEIRYRLHRDYAGALAAYERVLQLRPGLPEVHQTVAVVQRRQGKWREAIATSRKVVELGGPAQRGDVWPPLRRGARRDPSGRRARAHRFEPRLARHRWPARRPAGRRVRRMAGESHASRGGFRDDPWAAFYGGGFAWGP